MKIREIRPQIIDLVKRGTCFLVVTIFLTIPFKGKGEKKNEFSISNESNVVQEVDLPQYEDDSEEISLEIAGESANIDLNNPMSSVDEIRNALELADGMQDIFYNATFALVTHWEKTENYDRGKDYSNGNREYKRKVYRFVANENFNVEYFGDDLFKMFEFFRDNENASEIFDIIETYEQVKSFSQKEEKEFNTKEDIFEIEGTNIRIRVKTKDELSDERTSNILRKISYSLILFGFVVNSFNRRKRY